MWSAAWFQNVLIALNSFFQNVLIALNFVKLLIQRYSGNSSSTTFCIFIFHEKCFSFYIQLTDQIFFWLLLLLEILGNMCTAVVCFPGCDVINFEINFVFLMIHFSYMTKNSREKFIYVENKKLFFIIKSIFHHIKGLSFANNCFRPESASLRKSSNVFEGISPT